MARARARARVGRASCPWPPWPPAPPRDGRRTPASQPACPTQCAHTRTCMRSQARTGRRRTRSVTGRELACQGKGWYPARYARVVSSVPLLLAHTRVAAEEVIVHDKHAGGLPQASLLQHDLPHGEARRAACGVRRAACGVRRAACGVRRRRGCMSRASCACDARGVGARREVRGARSGPPTSWHGTSKWSGSRRCCPHRSGRWACRTTQRRPAWSIGTSGR